MNWIVILSLGLVAATIASQMLKKPKKIKKNPLLKNQVNVATDEPVADDESKVHRSVVSPEVIDRSSEDITTLYELYCKTVEKFPANKSVGHREGGKGPFKWITYKEGQERSAAFGAGMVQLGVKADAKIGIYAKNTVEWHLVEQGCYSQSYVIVSLYDTLGENAVQFILDDSEIEAAVVSEANFDKMINAAKGRKHLKYLVINGEKKRSYVDAAKDVGLELFSFEEILEKGMKNPSPPCPPTNTSLCSIMYTSGTTGNPKGVMLTHGNLIAAVDGLRMMHEDLYVEGEEVYLSYLPLAHIMERVGHSIIISAAGRIGFYGGDITKLLDDIAVCKPTLFVGAPRVFQKIYDKTFYGVQHSSALKKWLFETAYASKKAALEKGNDTPFWNKVVFTKLAKRILGGNVTKLVSGSAPLGPEVRDFLRIAFTTNMVEGYGLTETAAGATIQLAGDPQGANVGVALPSNEFKLKDVPSMSYLTSENPPRGEILIRGSNVSQGYYKNKEKTDESFINGWFYTGDIGRLNPDGSLSIIDRKKNIFKLSQGEYVAPEKLENGILTNPFVAQIHIHGESTEAQLVAAVVPDADTLLEWAKQKNLSGDMKSLVQTDAVKNKIMEEITTTARAQKFRGFEMIKGIHLDHELWSVDNELLTPTMKPKRFDIRKKYASALEDVYKRIKA